MAAVEFEAAQKKIPLCEAEIKQAAMVVDNADKYFENLRNRGPLAQTSSGVVGVPVPVPAVALIALFSALVSVSWSGAAAAVLRSDYRGFTDSEQPVLAM